MGIQSSMNPFGGLTLMSDRLIGDAYPVIKSLYDNMAMLTAIGAALTPSNIGSPLLTQRAVLGEGGTGVPGSTVVIDFPNLDMQLLKIIDSNVRILGNDGALYFSDCGHFTSKVTDQGLALTLKGTAPEALSEALVQWFIVYGGE